MKRTRSRQVAGGLRVTGQPAPRELRAPPARQVPANVAATRPIARYLLAAAVVLVVGTCFLPIVHNDFVSWDDPSYFLENREYRGLSWHHLKWMFTTVYLSHYQPLSWLSHALVYTVWGLDPTAYHLANLAIHAANAILLYWLIIRLLGGVWSERTPSGGIALYGAAGAGALFFAVHPFRVEVVAWSAERQDLLCGSFFLLTLLAYLRMARERQAGNRAWHGWLCLSAVCFALSLLSKATGLMLPVVLLVLDHYPLDRVAGANAVAGGARLTRTAVLVEKLPFAALSIMAAAVAAFVAKPVAMVSWSEHGLGQRAAQAVYGLCFYLWKTVVPTGLSPLYLLRLPLHPGEPRYLLCALLVAGITAWVIRGRQRAPWALAAWIWYVALLLPVLGFAQNGWQIAADRYTYLASLPWAVLLSAALYQWWRAWEAQQLGALVGYTLVACSGAGLAVLGMLTSQQTRVWHDSLALWNHALVVDPDNDIAYTNRGAVRRQRGDLEGALADFDAAIRLNSPHAQPYTGRGDARLARGDVDGALADLDTAIGRGANTPEVYVNRGTAHQTKGELDAAIADFTSALRLNPQLADAYYNRGNARQAQGDLRGALADYDAVLRLNPQHANAYNNRGNARRRNGDLEGAIADYGQAVQLTAVGAGLRAMFERNLAAARRELAEHLANQ